MFLSKTHLPQLLPAEAYASQEQYSLEIAKLFGPAWHCLAAVDQVRGEGDFCTGQVLGQPIIVWRREGKIRAFLNVCAHRFSTLTDKPCGKSSRLTCQYHGWQYDADGRTQKIPDAQSFKPLRDQALGLRTLDVKVCGKLVLARLADATAKSLPVPASLEPDWGVLASLCSEKYELVHAEEFHVAANWKLVIENAIESYHVGCVHANSFGVMPSGERCFHQLKENYSGFETDAPSQAPYLIQLGERWIHRQIGVPFSESYQHFLFYPNLLVSKNKMVSIVMSALPESPRSTRFVTKLFATRNLSNPLAKAAFRLACRWAIQSVRQVLNEDFEVLPSIQRGIESPQLPSGGLISIREERIHHFQALVQAMASR